jgi:hypothetical protein
MVNDDDDDDNLLLLLLLLTCAHFVIGPWAVELACK